MNNTLVEKAVRQFGGPGKIVIGAVGAGLIHHTYKITFTDTRNTMLLQAINRSVFKNPDDILFNYDLVYRYLQQQGKPDSLPKPLRTNDGSLSWTDEEGNYWRATAFIDHAYSPEVAATGQDAYTVARSFAAFTRSLSELDANSLKEIIPHFHDLAFRYRQFEESADKAEITRLLKSTHVMASLRERKKLVEWYDSIAHHPSYPNRVMHHDCKISNILFDERNNEVVCPVDMDTLMPGKFFSDLGDMIRSMSCAVDENSSQWEDIDIRPDFYRVIVQGYLDGIGNILTEAEQKDIHYSGLIMLYMQSLRFLTDFLNNDIYYKTGYPEQNLNRALNQLILLEKLESFLKETYRFDPYR